MRRTTLIILFSILYTGLISAQNEIDALRYSQRFFGSTARSVGMGGAFASLGGDFSSLGYNPAGIAVFRTTELTFTPSFSLDDVSTVYMSEMRSENEYGFGIDNLGFVASFNRNKETGWVGANLGLGYHRHNNFDRHQIIEGRNNQSSMADYFIYGPFGADGFFPDQLDPFWEGLAYRTYIIDNSEDDPTTYSPLVPLGIMQREIINTSGNTGEWLFSFGANYEHKLYFGASFGIESVDYTRNSNYTEINDQNPDYYFEQFEFRRNQSTSGTGYTFKAGAIYNPVEMIRLGASLHLPTFYSLKDEWDHKMESWFAPDFPAEFSNWEAVPVNQNDNPIGPRVKDYSLTTPFRFIGGVGFMLPGQLGVISVDYEYIDYTSMRLRETDGGYDFYNDNQIIQDVYRSTGNLKAGAELRFGQFMLRGGLALYGSPYASGELNENAGYTSYSGGFGFRESNFYIDFGYVMTKHEEHYFLYDYPEMESALGESSKNRFLVTVGLRF